MRSRNRSAEDQNEEESQEDYKDGVSGDSTLEAHGEESSSEALEQ